ncbi:hypothetical protein WJS89_04575 [Sphingomicrobium sp. XHP0235]|uniref:hypothetical protein n=1 Tax=Sphingomicrobium aquimarinum TaxID=3133971 RepID=UPI0031FE72F4
MKQLKLRLAIAACAFLSGCTSVDFVPDDGWQDDDWSADFYEQWFGEQLAAAQEPSFSEPADFKEFSRRFRLLILPSFAPASIYRIDETQSGRMILTYTLLTGKGVYDAGRIAQTNQRVLSLSESASFREVVDRAQLRSMTREAATVFVDESGNEIAMICADGTQVVAERLTTERRLFITRHECELERYPRFAALYDFVSKLKASD